MHSGALDRRATFRGRAIDDDGGFGVRGDFRDLYTVWAQFRPLSGRALAEAGSLTDAIEGTLVVRATARTRALTVAHRVVVDRRDYAIESVPPDDRTGFLVLRVSSRKASA